MELQIGCREFAGSAVLFDVQTVARCGRPIAASAGGLDDEKLVWPELQRSGLGRQLRAGPLGRMQQKASALSGRGTKNSPREVPEALTNTIELANVADRTNAAPQTHAAAEPPRTP